MPSIAGKKALVLVTGTPVAFTNEATTTADHQTYQITNTVKRIWDRATLLVVDVAGTPTGETYTFNRLAGTVTFATVNGARGTVTLSGAYLPTSVAAGTYGFSFAMTRTALLNIDFDGANTSGGVNTYQAGLLDVSGSLTQRILTTDTTLRDVLLDADLVVLQFFADRSGVADLTVWALIDKVALSAAVDSMQDGSIEFMGSADDQGVAIAS